MTAARSSTPISSPRWSWDRWWSWPRPWWPGRSPARSPAVPTTGPTFPSATMRSEEHTSELQSRLHLVCRLLLEKKKKKKQHNQQDDKNKTNNDANTYHKKRK